MSEGDVTLAWYEFLGCVEVGLYRFAASNLARLNHATSYQREWMERLHDEILGACGERAWCKYRDRYWDGSVNTFHHIPDAVGRVEIRTTPRLDGCLIVRENDAPDRWYILVTGSPPALHIAGYIRGEHARQDQYIRNPRDGTRPAWFVPQGDLIPPKAAAS